MNKFMLPENGNLDNDSISWKLNGHGNHEDNFRGGSPDFSLSVGSKF